MQIGGLFHEPETLDGVFRTDAPADAKARKRNLRKTVDLDHIVRAIESFERRNHASAQAQTGIDTVLDHGYLIPRGDIQEAPALGDWQNCPSGIMEIGRYED